MSSLVEDVASSFADEPAGQANSNDSNGSNGALQESGTAVSLDNFRSTPETCHSTTTSNSISSIPFNKLTKEQKRLLFTEYIDEEPARLEGLVNACHSIPETIDHSPEEIGEFLNKSRIGGSLDRILAKYPDLLPARVEAKQDVHQFLSEHQKAGTLTSVFDEHRQILGRALQSLEDNQNTLFNFLRKHRSIVADFLARHSNISILADFLAQYPTAMDRILDEERSIVENFIRNHPEVLYLYLSSDSAILQEYFEIYPHKLDTCLRANPVVVQGYFNTYPHELSACLNVNPAALQEYFNTYPHKLYTHMGANPDLVIEYLRENADIIHEYFNDRPEIPASNVIDPLVTKPPIETDNHQVTDKHLSDQIAGYATPTRGPSFSPITPPQESEYDGGDNATVAQTGKYAARLLTELAEDYNNEHSENTSQEKDKGRDKSSGNVTNKKISATSGTCKDAQDDTIYNITSDEDEHDNHEESKPVRGQKRPPSTPARPSASRGKYPVVQEKKAVQNEKDYDPEATESDFVSTDDDEDYGEYNSDQKDEDEDKDDEDDDDDDYQDDTTRTAIGAQVNSSAFYTAPTNPGASLDRVNIPYPAPAQLLVEDDEKVRISSTKKKEWTLREEDCAIKHMLAVRNRKKFKGEDRFREAARRMNKELGGQERTWASFKNFWNRVGRARSGFDERRPHRQSAPLATSLQSKKNQKIKSKNRNKKQATAKNKIQAKIKNVSKVWDINPMAGPSGLKRKKYDEGNDDEEEEEEGEMAAVRALANGTRPKKVVKYTE